MVWSPHTVSRNFVDLVISATPKPLCTKGNGRVSHSSPRSNLTEKGWWCFLMVGDIAVKRRCFLLRNSHTPHLHTYIYTHHVFTPPLATSPFLTPSLSTPLLVLQIFRAGHLPATSIDGSQSDPYVLIYCNNKQYKTRTKWGTLHPRYDER